MMDLNLGYFLLVYFILSKSDCLLKVNRKTFRFESGVTQSHQWQWAYIIG